jgi:hypothetical protein
MNTTATRTHTGTLTLTHECGTTVTLTPTGGNRMDGWFYDNSASQFCGNCESASRSAVMRYEMPDRY